MAKSRSFGTVTGSYTTLTGSIASLTKNIGQEVVTIDNTAGNHVNVNAFHLNRTKVSGGLAVGEFRTSPTNGRICSNFPSSNLYDRYTLSPPSLPVPSDLASKLFARVNPFRAEILLPTFVFELRELPDMIRQIGRFNIWKNSGKAPRPGDKRIPAQMWLSGNFGWAPLVSDLVNLLGFAESFSRRQKEFNAIYSKGGMSRKVKLYSGSGSPATIGYTNGATTIAGTFTRTAIGIPKVDCWGSVRIIPKASSNGHPVSQPPPHEVASAILGLSRNNVAANAWESLPWSWLIDYFVNVGDYIDAHSGGLDFAFNHACIMTHNYIEYTGEGYSTQLDALGKRISVTPARVFSESKARSIVFNPPLPEFRVGLLSGHQLSILGALHVTRFRNPRTG